MTPGLDISSWQTFEDPDEFFAAAYRSGMRFCYIKATEGNGVRSKVYKERYLAARRQGLHAGPYHFAGPERSVDDAKREAELMYEVTGPWNPGDLPPAIDLESVPSGMNPAELQQWLEEWLRTIEGMCGRRPLVYSYQAFILHFLHNFPLLKEWGLWLACYNGQDSVRAPAPWDEWRFWQWIGDAGRVPWYKGAVDLDWFNGSEAELQMFCGGGV